MDILTTHNLPPQLKNSAFGQLNSTRPIVVLNHVDKFQVAGRVTGNWVVVVLGVVVGWW